MARCTATPPCNYKANGEIHDHGCPARAGYYDGELGELYATETATERVRLDAVLRRLLIAHGADDYDEADVTGGDAEWLHLRRAIRQAGDGWRWADVTRLAATLTLAVTDDGPALTIRTAPTLTS